MEEYDEFDTFEKVELRKQRAARPRAHGHCGS